MSRLSSTTNRRPAGRRLLLASVLGVLLAGCGRAPAPTSSASPSAIVPWLPRPAAHLYPELPSPSPSSPIPVPTGTPPCGAGQLEATGTSGGAATGHVDLPLILRNRGASACFLEGYAEVGIVDASGDLLAQAVGTAGRGTFFRDGPAVPVLMEPGTALLTPGQTPQWRGDRGQAWMNLEWYDCRHRQSARVLVDLPAGGGRISAPFPFTAPYSPVCDSPGHGADSGALRGPLSPSGFAWPPAPALIAVAVSISAPASVHRGSTLQYTTAMRNESPGQYRLDPCPDYVEILGEKQAGSSYQLNCSPVGILPPGGSVIFEMRLAVPAALPSGTTQLSWTLLDGRLATPTATTTVGVV